MVAILGGVAQGCYLAHQSNHLVEQAVQVSPMEHDLHALCNHIGIAEGENPQCARTA